LLAALIGLSACSSTGPAPDGERRAGPGLVDPRASRPDRPSTSVPIQFINNSLILVPVLLNDTYPATLMLDTGANVTVISREMVRRAGLDAAVLPARAKVRLANGLDVETSLARLQAISVGAARIPNFGVAVFDFTVPGVAGQPLAVDGLLGINFLARFIMTVDVQAGTLTLQLPAPR
jgi:hypothetical protein